MEQKMKSVLSGSWVLLTGASSGIGWELAKIFAERGYSLVLVARREGELQRLAQELRRDHGVEIRVLPKDLERSEAPDEIFDELKKQKIEIDVLVNNAGFGLHGYFHEQDPQKILALLQVNVVALTRLTRLFLEPMLQRAGGQILNVASTAAFQPGPLMAVYYASKAYVLHFSEALDKELSGTGVRVSTLCPGPTESEFQQRAGMENVALFQVNHVMDSATVARQAYQGLSSGKRVVVTGWTNRLLSNIVRWAPRNWVLSVVKRINSRR